MSRPKITVPALNSRFKNPAAIRLSRRRIRGPWKDHLTQDCLNTALLASEHTYCHCVLYIMSLSRKLYFPKSLSFGAIRWSFLALASFIKRNSLRSIHSFSSGSPCASLHNSSSVQVPLRNLSEGKSFKVHYGTSINSWVKILHQHSARNLTSHKLWKCLWEIGTASSSDHPQSWKRGLCVFLKWCAAATVSHCCSFYHTANSDYPPVDTHTKSHLQITNTLVFLNSENLSLFTLIK